MLLYIHVPFCRTRCNYCAFHSVPLGRQGSVTESPAFREYVDTLFMELALWGDRYKGMPVSSIFLGGGTPSLVPPRILQVLLDRVRAIFTVAGNAEITLEANPESVSSHNQIRAYASAGVNRLSIGMQSLDDAYLRLLGRSHKAKDSFHSVFNAREAGIQNINVDVMWGLPQQGVRHWLNTLKDVIRMKPEHISSYGLTIEPGTPLELDCTEGLVSLPPERDQSVMFMEGAALLESMGYLHYEISNFARMGFQCRHNVGYWEGEDYLGLGPSATSTIQNRRWTNPASQKAWAAGVQAQTLDASPEWLTPRLRVLELIMLRLRTARGMRVKAYRELTGRDFLRDHQRMVRALHENGLIRIRDGYLRLTRSGMLVSSSILANLFEQTDEQLKKHPLPELVSPAPETGIA
ncbi:MAG: radical SAM family heme chaperone HemW [Desulfovibrionaceae bacterium]